jgi:hypothetical protein
MDVRFHGHDEATERWSALSPTRFEYGRRYVSVLGTSRSTFDAGIRLSLLAIAMTCLTTLAAGGGSMALEGARPATNEEISLLNGLLHQTADDLGRWAYTEHRVLRDHKGKVKSEHVVRYDPSKPYAEQWTPIKINGREPTERDRTKHRRRGESAAPNDKPRVEKRPQRPALGEVIDVTRSSVAAETPSHLLFEIPLLKFGNERFPPEKFQVHARVRKDGYLLENIAVRLRESFRSKLVVSVKSGEGSLDFAQVDPKYPPTLVAIDGDAVASVLFVSIGGSVELRRTELKHVKPFDERFEVQIGTLRAIDF